MSPTEQKEKHIQLTSGRMDLRDNVGIIHIDLYVYKASYRIPTH